VVVNSDDVEVPMSPSAATAQRPAMTRSLSAAPVARTPGSLYPPATLKGIDYAGMPAEPEWTPEMGQGDMVLELADGLALSGHSFGAQRSVAGECVFQTGTLLPL
jgi:carbamoyl-phosphate synthase/aspartate carbamoyltransferase